MDYKAIGQRIKMYRKARKLSQEQLAEKINISPTHMSHIETGSTKLSLPVLVDIASVLNVSTDNLLMEKTSADAEPFSKILERCTPVQSEIITEIVRNAKTTLDKYLP